MEYVDLIALLLWLRVKHLMGKCTQKSFTYPDVIAKLNDFHSSVKHKRRYFEFWLPLTLDKKHCQLSVVR